MALSRLHPVAFPALVAALALAAASCASAQTSEPAAPAAAPAVDVTKRLDPTDFKTRFEMRYERQFLRSGGTWSLLVPRYEHAFDKTVALRVDVPYVWNDPQQPGVSEADGVGDTTLRLNYRAARGEGYALVLGPEVLIPTASNDRVGLEKWVFQPVVFASVDMAKLNSVLFPFAQHFISFAGADNRSDINMTLLRTGVATRWPNRFYTYFEPSLYIDWEHDSQQGYTFELEFGRLLTNKFAVWARPGVGGGDIPWIYNWNFEVGFRYFLD